MAREHERLGQRDQERVVVDPVAPVQQGGGRGAGERDGDAVHRLPALALGDLPVGDRAQVRDHVADARAAHRGLAAAHEVEVDDDGDRHLHAVRALAGLLVLERGDGRGDAVVAEAGGHGDERQPGERGGVLGRVDRAAAADADERVVEAAAQPLAELDRRLQRAALHGPELSAAQLGRAQVGDLLPQPRPDDDGDPSAGGDAAVLEQRAELAHRARADVDAHRRRHHPRQ
jgi:hypothetical protein